MLLVWAIMIFRWNATHCILPYAIVVCVCVCVCVCVGACVRVCVRVCVPRLWTSRKRFEIETSSFSKLLEMTPDITYKSLHKSDYKFQDGGQNGGHETLYLAITQPFINPKTSFFHWIVRNDTGHQLYKIDTYPFTNSKMANKMAAVKHYNWL